MCRVTVTRHHTPSRENRISTEELCTLPVHRTVTGGVEAKLDIHGIRHYAHSRTLRYLGNRDTDKRVRFEYSRRVRLFCFCAHMVTGAQSISRTSVAEVPGGREDRGIGIRQQPKICHTTLRGTEIFPVPPFSRQLGRNQNP